MRRGLWLQIAAAALISIAAGLAVLLGSTGVLPPSVEQIRIGGAFRLMSHRGTIVDSRDLAGRPYAVFFGFTHCPVICPTTLYDLGNDLESLGPAGAGLQIYFITVDPERDRPELLAQYLSGFDPRIVGLVPTGAELASVARAFLEFYEKAPTSDGGYTMNHTASVYLLDANGRFAGTLAPSEEATTRRQKLRRLVGAPAGG
jgi:protein SCO1/2